MKSIFNVICYILSSSYRNCTGDISKSFEVSDSIPSINICNTRKIWSFASENVFFYTLRRTGIIFTIHIRVVKKMFNNQEAVRIIMSFNFTNKFVFKANLKPFVLHVLLITISWVKALFPPPDGAPESSLWNGSVVCLHGTVAPWGPSERCVQFHFFCRVFTFHLINTYRQLYF